MSFPYYLLLPFLSAFGFAAASLCFKRAFAEGATLRLTFLSNNTVLGIAFLPFLLWPSSAVAWSRVYQPMAAGLLFFLGNMTSFIAIRTGDVSLLTPLMGSKVIFVAFLAAGFFGIPITGKQWWAAALTALGVFFLGATDLRRSGKAGRTTMLALLTAFLFALCDVWFQRWAGGFGVNRFLPITFGTVTVLSLIAGFFWSEPLGNYQPAATKWLLLGAVGTALQSGLIAACISIFGDAPGVNVVYSTRGLWSLALVWFAGHWFGSSERHTVGGRMVWRVAGTILTTVAVVLTFQR